MLLLLKSTRHPKRHTCRKAGSQSYGSRWKRLDCQAHR